MHLHSTCCHSGLQLCMHHMRCQRTCNMTAFVGPKGLKHTTTDPLRSPITALRAVKQLCDSPGVTQAKQAPDNLFVACWSIIIALLQHLQGPTLHVIKQLISAQALKCASNQLYCQHGILQAIPAVKIVRQQRNIFCSGKRFRISSNTCGEFPILCSHNINNAEDVWRPGETLDYENGPLKLVC